MTAATPGSAELLALADRIEREKHALDHMDDGQPEGLGPTEATFFDTMDENAAVIVAALRLAAKPAEEGRDTLIERERCAKIAEPWPGFWLDENSSDVDRAVVAVRTEIAEKIRAVRL